MKITKEAITKGIVMKNNAAARKMIVTSVFHNEYMSMVTRTITIYFNRRIILSSFTSLNSYQSRARCRLSIAIYLHCKNSMRKRSEVYLVALIARSKGFLPDFLSS